jgi:hypothetical protein
MSPDEDSSSESEGESGKNSSENERVSDSVIDVKFLGIGVLVGIIMLSMFISTESESAQPVNDDRVYVNSSLSEIQSQLLSSDSTLTDLQKDEIWSSRYRGRWIEAEAYVHSVDENAFGELVVLAGPQPEGENDIGFSAYRIGFKDSERSDLLEVRRNERISFEGKLSDYGGISSSISISDARITE